jgi:hypothetical protein
MNDYISRILNHKFSEETSKDALTHMGKLLKGEPYSPSELERYAFSLMKQKQRLWYCFNALEHARVYMKHFRTNKWYREAGIVQSNYINYHYTKYAITVVTIMDVCLILTNDTFRLGNPERLCHPENIIKNSWVTSSKVDKSLNKLSKIVEPWREPRNLFIHRGERLWRDRLTALEELELDKAKGMLNIKVPLHRVKSLYKSELSEIFKEFDQVETPLFNAVIELLSKLLPVYISRREKLQTPP